jgi:Protein phosphatase 2C
MADVDESLGWRAYAMPKDGHGRDEYEDAFAADAAAGRFAIADGASESSFAGDWANLLVQGFTRQAGPWSGWLPAARKTWHETLKDREFSWYAENKFLEGAYATFLGVSFRRPSLSWQAVAIGDSCLFQMRDNRLLRCFPMRHAGAFGNQPALIGSRRSRTKVKRRHCSGDWQEKDQLLLMTDALAHWFLEKAEDHQEPWKEIMSAATQEDFEAWIVKNRAKKELRNDDVTMMVIGC